LGAQERRALVGGLGNGKQVDLEKGAISVLRQFTHGAWADLKTANSRRRIPLAKELVRQLRLHRLRTPGELVFPGPTGQPIDYHNWRGRVWAPLLTRRFYSRTS
jgi:integrase